MFGPVADDLLPGAHNAVEICLAIQPRRARGAGRRRGEPRGGGEPRAGAGDAGAARALRPDRVGRAAADDGGAAGSARRARARRRRHPVRPAAARRAAGAHGDRRGRRTAPDPLRAHGRRHAADHAQGMRADYRLVDRLSTQLCERMQQARVAHASGPPSGTDLHAPRSIAALAWVKTSGLINPRYWSNLPAGEVFTTPGSVDGTFVCDGTAGDYFNAKYGSSRRRRWCWRFARAGWCRRTASATISSASSGTTATPTRTAIASASSPSAPTSACAR